MGDEDAELEIGDVTDIARWIEFAKLLPFELPRDAPVPKPDREEPPDPELEPLVPVPPPVEAAMDESFDWLNSCRVLM